MPNGLRVPVSQQSQCFRPAKPTVSSEGQDQKPSVITTSVQDKALQRVDTCGYGCSSDAIYHSLSCYVSVVIPYRTSCIFSDTRNVTVKTEVAGRSFLSLSLFLHQKRGTPWEVNTQVSLLREVNHVLFQSVIFRDVDKITSWPVMQNQRSRSPTFSIA